MNSTPSNEPHMERQLGVVQATALNMSNMVGIGPFITIPLLIGAMGGPQAMLGWAIALIIALADGLVWSELGAAMPRSGGSYNFLREGFGTNRWGRLMSFLFIWQFLLSGPLETASGFIGFGSYLKFLWTGASDTTINLTVAFVAILCVVLLYRPIRNIGRIMVTMWIGMLITVAAVIYTGATHFDPKIAFAMPPDAWKITDTFWVGLGAASAIGMYDYLGYYNVCHLGDEVRDPGRTIPRSLFFSVVAVALLYVCINLSIMGIIPWQEFIKMPDAKEAPEIASWVVSEMMRRVWGNDVASLFTVLVLWTALASCIALLLGYSRIPYAAARDGNFFKVFGRLHPTGAFPHVSLIVLGLLAAAFSFLRLDTVINALLMTRIAVQFSGQIFALINLRRTQPDLVRPFKMWLYPLPAFVALVGWLFILATTRPAMLLVYGACAILGGVVAYFGLARTSGWWPFEATKA